MKSFTLEAAEREAITRALRETKGNVTNAARLLEISRPGLYQKIKNYDIDAKAFKAKSELAST